MHKTPSPFQIVPWNTDLLLSIKNLIVQMVDNPSDAVVIFPHSRPARHLVEQLRLAEDIPKPCLLPRMLTVQDLCGLMRAELPKRPHRTIELLDRVSLLYECVQRLAQNNDELSQHLNKGSMHQFFPWGVRLASLMEEFFTQNIQPANLAHADGEVSAFAAALLANLGHIYTSYEAALDARRWTTTGLDALRSCQNVHALPPSISNKTIIIAGFATLSGTEETIFKHMWQSGMAHIVLHTDHRILDVLHGRPAQHHWTCDDHIKWVRSWRADTILTCPPSKHQVKLDYCQGYDLHSQLHEVASILDQFGDVSHSAVVLPDTNLLMPVLHHIPDKNVNISMGYPLSRSTLFRLLETLMRLQERRKLGGQQGKGLYHWSPCIDFIRHPYIKMLSVEPCDAKTHEADASSASDSASPSGSEHPLIEILHAVEDKVREGSRFVDLELLFNEAIFSQTTVNMQGSSGLAQQISSAEPISEEARELLQKILTACLTAWEHATTPASIAMAMQELCHVLLTHGGDLWDRFPIDGECLYRLMERVIPSLQECSLKDQYFSQDVLFSIVRETIRNERVPFEADPLGGLQVLGMLESRLLHFKNIIVLDATDDALPGSAGHDPLLPDSLRPALNLPNAYRRERVTAHNFHRLLASAEHVTLLWQHSAGSGLLDSKRTRSRFVEELLWHEECKQGKIIQDGDGNVRAISCSVVPTPLTTAELVKTAAVREQMMHYLQKPLSPSRLNTYLTCPFRFFHECICGLRVPDAVHEGDDPAAIGDFLHQTLQAFYEPWRGRTIKDGDLQVADLQREFFKQFEASDMPDRLAADSLMMLKIAAPMRLASYLENQQSTMIVELESVVSADIIVDDCTIKLHGRIDRVDKREGLGHVILDYKSGSVTSFSNSVWNDDDLWIKLQSWHGDTQEGPDGHDLLLEVGKKISSIQLPCYLYMYDQSHPEASLYDAAYVELRDKGKERVLFGSTITDEDRVSAIQEQIPTLLTFLVRHLLLTPSFKACQGTHCDRCPFIHVCTIQDVEEP
ncbi:MAG: PD-(D/E)XK nuclease family protein [Pseudomonadota bacterium]